MMIVVFSGAGLSDESGISTFRGNDGLWEEYKIEEVASPLGWIENRKLVLDFYAQAFEKMQKCQPNAGHLAIAELANHFEVVCITQNIDTLLEKAGVKDIWHLHGRIDHQKCEWHFDIPPMYSNWQCDYKSAINKPVKIDDLCPKCGKNLRPDVVWFGEAVDMHVDDLYQIQNQVDMFIVVGTSAQVYPAANLLKFFQNVPRKYFIDPDPNSQVLDGFTVFKGTATEYLPALVESLKKELA
jgi:NAD-dependent deacetylase